MILVRIKKNNTTTRNDSYLFLKIFLLGVQKSGNYKREKGASLVTSTVFKALI